MAATQTSNPLHRLTPEQIEEIGEEFQKIHDEVFADLGDRDATYIRSIIDFHRRLGAISRIFLMASRYPPALILGTAGLSTAKILENMEIGHNVLHGQWDWMNDPKIHSSTWDWDTASTAKSWKHSHNYVHHTYTNILGKDKDLGYEIMRIDPHQKWHPVYLAQPFYNVVLALLFEWGVAFHDLDFEAIRKGEKTRAQLRRELKGIAGGVRLAAEHALGRRESRLARLRRRRGPSATERALDTARGTFVSTLIADATANLVRNVWSYSIIFCGHFPDQTYVYSQSEVEDETRGGFYVRQLTGAANIEGSPFFHVASGNLGYQVEHHLYPDMPSTRYAEIAPRVKEICERYGLPYNSGPFMQQLGMVQPTILRLAFPGGQPRPKPGPFHGG